MHWLARTVLFALLCTLAIPNTPFSHRRTRSHYTPSPHTRTRHARPSPVLSPRCNPKPPTHTHTHTPRPSPSQPEHPYCSLRTPRMHVTTRFTPTMFSAQVKDETVLAALKRILAELDWQNPDAEEVAFEEEEEEGTDTRTHGLTDTDTDASNRAMAPYVCLALSLALAHFLLFHCSLLFSIAPLTPFTPLTCPCSVPCPSHSPPRQSRWR